MTWRRSAATLAVACMMALSACGGGGAGEDPAAERSAAEGGNAGAFKNADAKAPVAVPDDAAEGGTLTVLTNQVPATLDPTQAYYTDSTAILSDLVLRSLTQFVYNPDTNDMQLIPDMATDLGRPTEDNKEWTFTLRDGLKYEDGTPVKAEDVAYAIKRVLRDRGAARRPDVQHDVLPGRRQVQGPVQGQGRVRRASRSNGNDITIKMRRPFTDMDYYASFPAFTAIPEAKDNPETYGKQAARDRPLQVRRLQGRHAAQAGQERPVGPEHRPGPHPGRRRMGLQVRPGHRQARERHHQRPGLRADHADLRQRQRRRPTARSRPTRTAWSPAPRRARTCGSST